MTIKIGDTLFTKRTIYSHLEKVTVEKITPKGAIRVSDGSLLTPDLRKKTSDAWDSSSYWDWSQELEDKYVLQNLTFEIKNKIENLDLKELNKEQLEKLSAVITEITDIKSVEVI